MLDKVEVYINDEYEGLSIKDFLKAYHVGKGKIEEIRVKSWSYINDKKTSLEQKLIKGDKLSFFFDEEVDITPSESPLEVLYEDEQILIVNKKDDILIHTDGFTLDTLASRVANYFLKNNIHRNVRYLHRIDKDTSGIVLFCKDFLSYSKLSYLMENHQVKRTYLALCENKFLQKQGTIDNYIGRDRHINNKYRVSTASDTSKRAITHYQVLYYDDKKNISLVKCGLETGRTHQIRVHMSSIHHPLIGDKIYNEKNKYPEMCLHSFQVQLINPLTFQKINVIAPLPNKMRVFTTKFRYSGIVFDLDGTLLNTIPDLTSAINQALKMNHYQISYNEQEAKKLIGSGTKVLCQRAIEKFNPRTEDIEQLFQDFTSSYLAKQLDQTLPYPQVEDTLLLLKALGIKLAVLSNKVEANTKKIIAHYFPLNLFDIVFGQRKDVPLKPNPTSLNMVIASLDINKNQCLYVGDSDVDMIVSNNACIDNIAVSWGYRDIDLLKSYHPKFNISQFSDIIKIILK